MTTFFTVLDRLRLSQRASGRARVGILLVATLLLSACLANLRPSVPDPDSAAPVQVEGENASADMPDAERSPVASPDPGAEEDDSAQPAEDGAYTPEDGQDSPAEPAAPNARGIAVRSVTPTAHALPALPALTARRTFTSTPAARGQGRPDAEMGTATGETERGLLPTPTPTPSPTATPPEPETAQGNATAANVNLRDGPGTFYAVRGQARAVDAPFEIVGRTESGDWLQICCPTGGDTRVWISADFVEVTLPPGKTLAALPVPEIPPTPVPPPAPRGPSQSAADLASAPAVGLPGPGNFAPPGGTNPLTGQGLPGGRGGQRPIIVCINNDFAARPQIGTSQADIMYEYLMEGYGITRMSGIYYGNEAGQIGPARSARLINYYLGALYDGGLACTGASDRVRYALKHEAPFPYMDFDLDDPNANRYSSSIGTDYRTRMRTSTGGLRRWLADWGVEKGPAIRSLTFGNAPGGGAPATAITIPYPRGTGSQVAYTYRDGRYFRSMGGGAHVDGATGAQLAYENVIVQFVTHEATNIVEDSLGSTSIRLNLFGSNRAIVFRDGQAFVGTWRSESRGDLPRFYDASGAEIPLKPGRTFFSIVPESYTITYQ